LTNPIRNFRIVILCLPVDGYGMAAEPSALGSKIKFSGRQYAEREYHIVVSPSRTSTKFPRIRSGERAFMARRFVIAFAMQNNAFSTTGKFFRSDSRGPMCTGGFCCAHTELMIDLVGSRNGRISGARSVDALDYRLLKEQHKSDRTSRRQFFILR